MAEADKRMSSVFDAIGKLSLKMLETGALTMHAGVKGMQRAIVDFAGNGGPPSYAAAPIQGPQNLDTALSDFFNGLVRIYRQSPLDPRCLPVATRDTLRLARNSFSFIDLADPRNLALPFEIPLSTGSMLLETLARGAAAYSTIGPNRLPVFADNTVETFSEVGLFISLQYKEIVDRQRQRLKEVPDDTRTRVELGRTLIKLGLFPDAARELEQATGDPGTRARACHELAVAHYLTGRYAEAAKAGAAALDANPDNERSRFWLWLSSRQLGGYPDYVSPSHRMEMKAGFHPTRLRYEEISSQIGLDKVSGGRGTAVFDYNNDGLLDVLVTCAHGGASLFRNNGDGTFTDVSVESGVDKCVNGFAVTLGDYDNDGHTDFYVTRLGFYAGECSLYHNNGDGTFTEVTKAAGAGNWGACFSASFVDYDCDGNLDLFIANNIGGLFDRGIPNRLLRNNGDGTFTDVTEASGLSSPWPTIGHAWGDYNNDGFPDLFLSNGIGPPQLYRNNGDGAFTEVSAEAGLGDYCLGTCCFWCDYDNDGWLDAVQYAWSDQEDVVATMKNGVGPADGKPSRVYHNNRDGTFTLKGAGIGLDQCWGTMSGSFADVNNDGNVDFLLGNGSPRMERLEPFIVMENDGRRFHNVTFAAGLPFTGKSHGVNAADLFGDGRLSILVAAGGGYPADLLSTAVYRPVELPGNYLNVRLAATRSNRSAIGARVELRAGGGVQIREVSGGTNFGCLPFEQHFGLGDMTAIDSLEIRWPSGLRQRIEQPPINHSILITEGKDGWADVYPNKSASV